MAEYSIQDLMERYELKTRRSIYQWVKGLKLNLHKGYGNRVYATSQQVEQLDQLKAHLDKGGTIATFAPVVDAVLDTAAPLNVYSPVSNQELDWLEMVGAIAGAISPPNPISHWEKLSVAAKEGFILRTSEVKALTGAKPRGEKWERGSFMFIRKKKIGNQIGWQVSAIMD